MTLGERISIKRKEIGLSQEKLGELFDVSRQTVYKWEADMAVPELDKLKGMASHGGILANIVIAALWEFLVMTGMHQVILIPGIMNLLAGNPDSCVMVAGGTANFVNGIIASLIAMFSTAVLTYFFGFDKDEPATK